MATFKGDNIELSLVTEDQGYGKPPSAYTGGQIVQNNDGTMNATRNGLESAARTKVAELSGMRLGNKQVAGNFPIELDAHNQKPLWESLMYGEFQKNGADAVLTGASVEATSKYYITIGMTSGEQTGIALKIGDAYLATGVSLAALSELEGAPLVAISNTSTTVTFLCPSQTSDTIAATTTDITIKVLENLRKDTLVKSFNMEERLVSEDGLSNARFMTTGGIVSGVSLDIPSEGLITGDFSFIGKGHLVSKQYEYFDSNLTNETDAHVSPTGHIKYDPMVLQDGAIVSGGGEEIGCQWLSGSLSIENGTETYFTGCDFEARGAFSGRLAVTLDYEALFESEDDFIKFENETQSQLLIHLKDPKSYQCVILYLPAFKRSSYTGNRGTGLVTASIQARAIIDPSAGNSIVVAVYDTNA